MGKKDGLMAKNAKAYHDYFIEDTQEAGIMLTGTEIKSARVNGVSLHDAYIMVCDGKIMLHGMHIKPYEQGNIWNTDPDRDRVLLMHRHEISRLAEAVKTKGCALIPTEITMRHGIMKVNVGTCRGKKLYDKRRSLAAHDQERNAEREYKVSLR